MGIDRSGAHIDEEITQQKPIYREWCAHQQCREGQVERHELYALGPNHHALKNQMNGGMWETWQNQFDIKS